MLRGRLGWLAWFEELRDGYPEFFRRFIVKILVSSKAGVFVCSYLSFGRVSKFAVEV